MDDRSSRALLLGSYQGMLHAAILAGLGELSGFYDVDTPVPPRLAFEPLVGSTVTAPFDRSADGYIVSYRESHQVCGKIYWRVELEA